MICAEYIWIDGYQPTANVRSKTNCGACTKLSQFFDNEIYSSI